MGDTSQESFVTPKFKNLIVNETRICCFVFSLMFVVSFLTGNLNNLFIYWLIPTLIGQPFLRFYVFSGII